MKTRLRSQVVDEPLAALLHAKNHPEGTSVRRCPQRFCISLNIIKIHPTHHRAKARTLFRPGILVSPPEAQNFRRATRAGLGTYLPFTDPPPSEIVPPQKPVFCPDGQFQGRGGQFQGSRGDNLCSPFFTPKRPPPYSTRNCPPFLPYVILSPPHFFPQGGEGRYAQNHYSSSKIPLHFLQWTLIFFRSKKMEKARVPAHPCKNRLVQPLLWCGLVHTGQSASYSQQHGPGPPDFSRKKTTCANHRHFLSSLKCSLEPGGREGNSYLLTQWWVCMSNDVLVPGEWTECEVCF